MGTVIGIFSAKGGVGKTLLATNLAVAFGAGYHRKTLLIDLNTGYGTADLLLDLTPDRSWSDLFPVFEELTIRHINFTVTEYRPGVDLLASPPSLAAADEITIKELSLLFETIKKEYEVIVLDTPSGIGPTVIGSLALADIRLLILTPDLPSLRSASRFTTALVNPEMVAGLVINQFSEGSAITPDEIQDHLRQPIFSVFPIDQPAVWTNISYGEPCVLRKSNKLGKAIRKLSAKLLSLIDRDKIQECNVKSI